MSVPTDLTGAQRMLERIFNEHDRRYFQSIEKLMLKFVNAIGALTKTKRHTKSIFGQEAKCVVNIWVWYNAICSFYQFKVEDLLWMKFPGVCPYCLAERDCNCERDLRDISGKSLPSFRKTMVRPKTIAEWQEMFGRIYGKANLRAAFEYAVFRLFEEIEEVNGCIFPEVRDPEALQMELADLGARIFGLASLLKIDLQAHFIRLYRGVCPMCLKEKCTCTAGW